MREIDLTPKTPFILIIANNGSHLYVYIDYLVLLNPQQTL